jgi:hypothetical protein
VLVVDDNSDIRDLIALYSQALGCLPMKAANGEEALEKLKGDPKPDLIFLDFDDAGDERLANRTPTGTRSCTVENSHGYHYRLCGKSRKTRQKSRGCPQASDH